MLISLVIKVSFKFLYFLIIIILLLTVSKLYQSIIFFIIILGENFKFSLKLGCCLVVLLQKL